MDPLNTEAPTATAGCSEESSKRPASTSPQKLNQNQEATLSPSKDGPVAKKARLDDTPATERRKGIAPIKPEFIIPHETHQPLAPAPDDDAAEAKPSSSHPINSGVPAGGRKFTKSEKQARQGQNKARKFGRFGEAVALCRTRVLDNESADITCPFGEKCRETHNIREYLEGRENLIEGVICPIWKDRGKCPAGWKCKWIKSHMEEVAVATDASDVDGAPKELRLLVDQDVSNAFQSCRQAQEGTKNEISGEDKKLLMHKKFQYTKSEPFLKYLNETAGEQPSVKENSKDNDKVAGQATESRDNNASYVEAPSRPSEKRPLYISASTPLLAPLTTTGNLPFRRLCTSLGASITYSEMAMSIPLLKGEKGEWALVRAHTSEKNFGVQISAKKPWEAIRATELLAHYAPSLNLIDMNSGCPIDLVYRSGGGAALLEQQSKLSKMLRGMNYVSGDIPVTVKIRTGCSDKNPTAKKLIRRLIDEGDVAAITLHGRSRQQRYSREADWGYIAECSALIQRMKSEKQDAMDTTADDKDTPESRRLVPYFVGNGDCYSFEDYYSAVDNSHVDSVLVARGALIKPWIFEEIHSRQYLDKTGTERLAYVEQFAKYGLEYWGSDEMGVNNTRRFLCEFLSFTHRYVPIGLLELLPPRLQDRPPRYKGRNELETLLSSDNYKDWIKISEMFLGKASEDFKFIPKHKSNSYDSVEAEG